MAWTDRYVTASASGSGGGTSESDAWTLSQAVSGASAGYRVNIKAGTYTLNSNITQSNSGNETSNIWWRGYKTSVGDLDEKFTGDKTAGTDTPKIVTTDYGYVILNGDYFHLSGIDFESQSTNYSALYDRRAYAWANNCRFHNAYTASHEAVDGSGNIFCTYMNCQFSAYNNGGSTTMYLVDSGQNVTYLGCLFKAEQANAHNGLLVNWSGSYTSVQGCIFHNLANGIKASQHSHLAITNCTFSDLSGDAIGMTTYSNNYTTTGSVISSNYFDNISGYCINNSGTVALSGILTANNVYRAASTKFNNLGDMVEFDALADSSDEFENKAAYDFSLKSTSSGYSAGTGGYWSYPTTDYKDAGAVQHQDPSGGGGGGATLHPLRSN